MEAQQRLAALQQELGPAFDPLLQFAKNEAQALGKQREFNAANPAWCDDAQIRRLRGRVSEGQQNVC